jgi:hypothetical protein
MSVWFYGVNFFSTNVCMIDTYQYLSSLIKYWAAIPVDNTGFRSASESDEIYLSYHIAYTGAYQEVFFINALAPLHMMNVANPKIKSLSTVLCARSDIKI